MGVEEEALREDGSWRESGEECGYCDRCGSKLTQTASQVFLLIC
jgi:hypothetical protein